MEHTLHALVTCKAVKKIWQLSTLASAIQEMGNLDILGDLMMLQKKLRRADIELLVTIFWVIWLARNKFIFERLKLDPSLSMAKAEAIIKAFRRTQFPEVLNKKKVWKTKQTTWTPPPQGWLKISVDVATDIKRQCFGLVAIIRDSTRKCIAACIKSAKFRGDVSLMEAKVAEWGIQIGQ